MNRTLTPVKAIRAKCLECCGNRFKEVRGCVKVACALHPYRLGRHPGRRGIGGRAKERECGLPK